MAASEHSSRRAATLLLAALCAAVLPAPVLGLTAQEILDKVDDLYRGTSAKGRMTMHIVTEHWERSLTIECWSRGKDESLLRVLAPQKEKGTGTLRVGNNIWNYLPKVNRVVKLPSSMMSAAWMGSHFTNDDLVKESRFTDDYDFEVTFEGERDGRREVEITCLPRPDAAVVWGKVVVVVDPENYLPRRMLYYDEDMALARTMDFSDVRTFDGRLVPAELTIVPQDKPREKTQVVYEDMSFDLQLDDETFTLRNLQR